MKAVLKAHGEAIVEFVELMSIAGWVALLADLVWVIRDATLASYPLSILPVFILLSLGFTIMTIALIKYHNKQHKAILKLKLQEKLERVHLKHKHIGIR